MKRENDIPEKFLREDVMLTESLRGSNESAAKVKSGLIQYLSSRVAEED
jgi:hypothetical protein